MAAPADKEAKLWRQIEDKAEFGDAPAPIGKYLGDHHVLKRTGVTTDFTYGMRDFMLNTAAKLNAKL
eukprot:2861254-Heterocapsa_arctica.AAC.1